MSVISKTGKYIGLVLHDTPKYSETFFMSKIEGLVNSGYNVLLFAPNMKKMKISGCTIIEPPVVKSNSVLSYMFLIIPLIKLLFRNPQRLKKFLSLEMGTNKSFVNSVKNACLNSHILLKDFEWIHFGFATCAINRENIATVVGAKMAISFRGYDINVYPLKFPNAYTSIWNKVDKVHSISDSLYAKALQLGLSPNTPYSKITPAIDVDFYNKVDKISKSKTLRLFTVGRLTWIKGFDYSIEAMKILSDRGIDFKYTIAGDGALNERLKYLVHLYGLQDKVIFVGAITKGEILSYLRKTDIYLQPSLEEGFCNAILEAQSCQCLCIASNVGGLRENIVDDESGWLVKKRSPDAIANKVIEVLNLSEEKKSKVRAYATNRVKTKFSLEEQIQKFSKFYL
ncbi:glycosyltransferase family 4 protein [Saccharicrinis aurantiacus]|uniref:glycosyltransferase family 4 protein n=1 Tax=Saccharicrinis aurantiacus TaxID=1849719 RepID=UPI0008399B13|nr:glycosyltransferase family 4 protein [Saccharicrinis aurantiacus]